MDFKTAIAISILALPAVSQANRRVDRRIEVTFNQNFTTGSKRDSRGEYSQTIEGLRDHKNCLITVATGLPNQKITSGETWRLILDGEHGDSYVRTAHRKVTKVSSRADAAKIETAFEFVDRTASKEDRAGHYPKHRSVRAICTDDVSWSETVAQFKIPGYKRLLRMVRPYFDVGDFPLPGR